MLPELWSPLVEQALRVAAVAHQGQVRKGSDIPYITHPLAVALILVQSGWSDAEVLAAALLHDVVEDTAVTLAELERKFPAAVVATVAGLSERKLDDAGRPRPWLDRKQDHLAELSHASLAVRAVTLADKLHNLETLLLDAAQDSQVWTRFKGSPQQLVWYYRATLAAARGTEPALQPLAAAVESAINRLAALVANLPPR
jgi:(p)ppGpp synthase/HD superfamily hydrolase